MKYFQVCFLICAPSNSSSVKQMSVKIEHPFWGCRVQFPSLRLFFQGPDNSVAPTAPRSTDNNSHLTLQTAGPPYRPIWHIISTSQQTYLPHQLLKVSLKRHVQRCQLEKHFTYVRGRWLEGWRRCVRLQSRFVNGTAGTAAKFYWHLQTRPSPHKGRY